MLLPAISSDRGKTEISGLTRRLARRCVTAARAALTRPTFARSPTSLSRSTLPWATLPGTSLSGAAATTFAAPTATFAAASIAAATSSGGGAGILRDAAVLGGEGGRYEAGGANRQRCQ
jgi:hypothetical protein